MTISVVVAMEGGQFSARPLGIEDLQCVANSREEALAALRHELTRRFAIGELVNLELNSIGLSGLSGIFKDDPEWLGIRKDIYEYRDAERLE